MFGLTELSPWGVAIGRFHKDAENRDRKPDAGRVGERIAIHEGQAIDDGMVKLARRRYAGGSVPKHLEPLLDWMISQRMHTGSSALTRGKIVATALLVGYVRPPRADWNMPKPDPLSFAHFIQGHDKAVLNAPKSPWYAGNEKVAWVFVDKLWLPHPVGPTRGYQGFWPLPEDIELAVRREEAVARDLQRLGA